MSKQKKNKIFVLALDGVPFTFLQKMIASGKMPHLARLAKKGDFRKMESVIPPVSSVAWASFLTGKKPQDHGILSFTERNPATMDWFTPDAKQLKCKTLPEILSERGKRVFIMNVPATYPPKKINGVSICGFLGNDLLKGTYPTEEGKILQKKGYRIDADTSLAKTDFPAFLQDLKSVLEKRIEIMRHYFEQEKWDFFMAHIMETDRLHHFTWEFMATGNAHFVELYDRFYGRLDKLIGEIINEIDDNMALMLLSDHGFTILKKEVYLNNWLWQNNYLRFTKPIPQSLHDIHPESKAYALYPGRIFINLKEREKNGRVEQGREYESIRTEIKSKLLELKEPGANDKVIKKVFYGEDLYGRAPMDFADKHSFTDYADLIAIAHKGYDLKGVLWNKDLFAKTIFNGMHTFDDAFVLLNGGVFSKENLAISDLAPDILKIVQ
jgi:predicted AlkP superfamily phosphohydrolase/phosphomutase